MRTAFGKTYLGGNAPRPIIPNVEACANIIRSRRLLPPPPKQMPRRAPAVSRAYIQRAVEPVVAASAHFWRMATPKKSNCAQYYYGAS